jgi:hypothetical protein
MLLFEPWVGSNYRRNGLNGHRVLVLGESHYGHPHEEVSSFTIECIEGMAKVEKGHAFFTKTAKLLVETSAPLTLDEKKAFWDSVAFFNYVQSFPSSTARKRPTRTMWETAATVFPSVVAELSPTFILVLGRALYANLPDLSTNAVLCPIPHPSSFGFRPAIWRPVVRQALLET